MQDINITELRPDYIVYDYGKHVCLSDIVDFEITGATSNLSARTNDIDELVYDKPIDDFATISEYVGVNVRITPKIPVTISYKKYGNSNLKTIKPDIEPYTINDDQTDSDGFKRVSFNNDSLSTSTIPMIYLKENFIDNSIMANIHLCKFPINTDSIADSLEKSNILENKSYNFTLRAIQSVFQSYVPRNEYEPYYEYRKNPDTTHWQLYRRSYPLSFQEFAKYITFSLKFVVDDAFPEDEESENNEISQS